MLDFVWKMGRGKTAVCVQMCVMQYAYTVLSIQIGGGAKQSCPDRVSHEVEVRV